ncbi:ECF-type sigma factor [Fodinibius saliphilus]
MKVANKNHFLAIAARCMRQILVDHARKNRQKKGEPTTGILRSSMSC